MASGNPGAVQLGEFTGIVQCDGYGAYKHIEAPDREGGPGTLAFCWAHVRRGFFDNAKGGNAPVADEALRRIASLYKIEARIRGSSPEHRLAVRQAESGLSGFPCVGGRLNITPPWP